jgi:ribosomal protein L1
MNEDTFNIDIRKFLKHFGVTAQREIEKAVAGALETGALRGDETLRVRATLVIDGLAADHEIDGEIRLA